jgi:acyl carrier protein
MVGRSAVKHLGETIEPEIRRLVADRLGVGPEELAPHVSLPDDLAADSLDLLELALACEQRWGLAIPDERLDAVRTYGEFVDSVAWARGRRAARPAGWTPPTSRFRILSRARARPERSGPLDPYTVEILLDEARRAGPDAWLELEVDECDASAARAASAPLAARGVGISVRRAAPAPSARPARGSRR